MNVQKIIPLIYYLLLLTGAVMHSLDEISISPYVFSAGALLTIGWAVFTMWKNTSSDFRKKRLLGINFLASLLLALAAYLMFTASNSWVVLVLIYALIVLFLSFRIK